MFGVQPSFSYIYICDHMCVLVLFVCLKRPSITCSCSRTPIRWSFKPRGSPPVSFTSVFNCCFSFGLAFDHTPLSAALLLLLGKDRRKVHSVYSTSSTSSRASCLPPLSSWGLPRSTTLSTLNHRNHKIALKTSPGIAVSSNQPQSSAS